MKTALEVATVINNGTLRYNPDIFYDEFKNEGCGVAAIFFAEGCSFKDRSDGQFYYTYLFEKLELLGYTYYFLKGVSDRLQALTYNDSLVLVDSLLNEYKKGFEFAEEISTHISLPIHRRSFPCLADFVV